MMTTDSIADMIIRIKNALAAGHTEVVIPHSKLKAAIAEILVRENYVSKTESLEMKPQNQIKLKLRYEGSLPAISGVKRASKPGRRLYVSVNKIPVTLDGYGITLLSTNQGILTDKEARLKNVGGEIICQIW
ncbi:30S ribosomal protein S8 [Patescibacteria group bacterium]|nr:30S ribosomal protein S8 [Patescibacteria group bacterium]